MQIAGILNLTPDSFSDGGRYSAPERALERALELRAEGADWVDVGGESTRPGAATVSQEQELERVIEVVRALAASGVPVSVDTRKAQVAVQALEAGARVVNDVGGFRDPAMVEAVAQAGAGAVIMHMRGQPKTMQQSTDYADVVEQVYAFLEQRVAALRAAGVERIWADPGIGFGKSPEQCALLLRSLARFQELGVPLYIGASRKSFIAGLAGGVPVHERLPGSLAAAAAAVRGGAAVLRVHDVAQTRQFLSVLQACS